MGLVWFGAFWSLQKTLALNAGRATILFTMCRLSSTDPRCFLFGLMLTVLALLGQNLAGMAAFGQIARLSPAGLAADIPICHAGSPEDDGGGAPAGSHHGMDHALCALCQFAAPAPVLPAKLPGPWRPFFAVVAASRPVPPARAPPVPAVLDATFPTGPPHLA